MNKAAPIISFILGAGVGALVTWHMVKGYYEEFTQEQIDSVKETYSNRAKKPVLKVVESEPEKEADEQMTLFSTGLTPQDQGDFVNYAGIPTSEPVNGPVIIDEDEFGEDEMYDKQTLTYYADGSLADMFDNLVDHEVLGIENLGKLLSREDDAVAYIRNDEYQTYYEVIFDSHSYEEIASTEIPSQEE